MWVTTHCLQVYNSLFSRIHHGFHPRRRWRTESMQFFLPLDPPPWMETFCFSQKQGILGDLDCGFSDPDHSLSFHYCWQNCFVLVWISGFLWKVRPFAVFKNRFHTWQNRFHSMQNIISQWLKQFWQYLKRISLEAKQISLKAKHIWQWIKQFFTVAKTDFTWGKTDFTLAKIHFIAYKP